MWGTSLFWLLALLSISLLLLSLSTPSPPSLPKWHTCCIPPMKILNIASSMVISWVNGQKFENILQFNTSWLASLRTWYYFGFCFSFNCSAYDLILTKKSHTSNSKFVVGNCGHFPRKVDIESKNENKFLWLLTIFYCENTPWRCKI